MNLQKALFPGLLALWLLLPAGGAAAERVQRSTDQQGTVHIGNPSPAKQETAGEVKAPPAGQEKAPDQQGKAGEVSAPPGPAAPAQPPPGLLPSHSRRTRFGPGGEIIPRPVSPTLSHSPSAPPPPQPGVPAPKTPPAKPERPSSPESR